MIDRAVLSDEQRLTHTAQPWRNPENTLVRNKGGKLRQGVHECSINQRHKVSPL